MHICVCVLCTSSFSIFLIIAPIRVWILWIYWHIYCVWLRSIFHLMREGFYNFFFNNISSNVCLSIFWRDKIVNNNFIRNVFIENRSKLHFQRFKKQFYWLMLKWKKKFHFFQWDLWFIFLSPWKRYMLCGAIEDLIVLRWMSQLRQRRNAVRNKIILLNFMERTAARTLFAKFKASTCSGWRSMQFTLYVADWISRYCSLKKSFRTGSYRCSCRFTVIVTAN